MTSAGHHKALEGISACKSGFDCFTNCTSQSISQTAPHKLHLPADLVPSLEATATVSSRSLKKGRSQNTPASRTSRTGWLVPRAKRTPVATNAPSRVGTGSPMVRVSPAQRWCRSRRPSLTRGRSQPPRRGRWPLLMARTDSVRLFQVSRWRLQLKRRSDLG